jgi:UDP-N-acetylmuramoyl-tripeptide--D-alanyl-D-alanine ligase
VACAVAVALELGVTPQQIAGRLGGLPTAPHRLESATGAGGFTVLDDTYNANPAGATAALATLRRLGTDATRRVVVTPGMVELGPRQAEENGGFAARVAEVATDLVVVGRTNRRALLRGVPPPSSSGGAPRIVVVRTRPEATAWVRDHLEHGDVVLYENDLPDHYP